MRVLCIAILMLMMGIAASAQTPTVLPAGQPVTVAWDPPASTGPQDAPTGYRFETFTETATGVAITTTNVPLTPTTATLPATALPQTGPFLLAVRAFNTYGVSGRSNALPFVRPEAPKIPANLRIVTTP